MSSIEHLCVDTHLWNVHVTSTSPNTRTVCIWRLDTVLDLSEFSQRSFTLDESSVECAVLALPQLMDDILGGYGVERLSPEQLHIVAAMVGAVHQGNGRRPCRPLAFVDEQRLLNSDIVTQLRVTVCHQACCECKYRTDKPLRRCSACGLTNVTEHMERCGQCHSMFYCSVDCMQLDAKQHVDECRLITCYKDIDAELNMSPLSLVCDTTADDFDSGKLAELLRFYGVHNLGMWLRETPNCADCTPLPGYGDLDISLDPYVLPMEGLTLEDLSVTSPTQPLSSWKDYYDWRAISLNSPIALLMHSCLTVYHIIQLEGLTDRSSLSIVLAGVDKEADLLPTFLELSALLPLMSLSLTLIGPLISVKSNHRKYAKNKIQIELIRGLLQDLFTQQHCNTIDLVICLNAGLSAYTTWKEAAILLHRHRLPCYITDYCMMSMEYSQRALSSLTADLQCDALAMPSLQDNEVTTPSMLLVPSIMLGQLHTNPFRSPFRQYSECDLCSKYSNAFISPLVYNVT